MTELDSVPGGVGLTAYLNEVYAEDFPRVIGAHSMPDRFMASLARLTPLEKFPLVAIVVSDEAATYRPEFEWLGEKLRTLGHDVHVIAPAQIMQMGDGSYIPVDGAPRRVDILYRFFELFDLANVKGADGIFNAVEAGTLMLPSESYALAFDLPCSLCVVHLSSATIPVAPLGGASFSLNVSVALLSQTSVASAPVTFVESPSLNDVYETLVAVVPLTATVQRGFNFGQPNQRPAQARVIGGHAAGRISSILMSRRSAAFSRRRSASASTMRSVFCRAFSVTKLWVNASAPMPATPSSLSPIRRRASA
jgi:hypothetical protein